jgi:hypothetical protein
MTFLKFKIKKNCEEAGRIRLASLYIGVSLQIQRINQITLFDQAEKLLNLTPKVFPKKTKRNRQVYAIEAKDAAILTTIKLFY